MVEAQRRDRAAAGGVEQSKRQQVVLVGRQGDHSGSEGSGDQERRTGAEPIDQPAAGKAAGAPDHEDAAEDRS